MHAAQPATATVPRRRARQHRVRGRTPRPGSRSTTCGPGRPRTRTCYDVEVEPGRRPGHVATSGCGPSASARTSTACRGCCSTATPYLHVGVLDQGYWPDGLLTAPSDDGDGARHRDDEAASASPCCASTSRSSRCGGTHHCDRLGMLVWQDVVNGGGRYRTAAVTWPGRYPIRLDDTRRRGADGPRRRGRPRAVPRGAAAHRRAPAQRRVDRRVGAVQRGLGPVRRRRGRRRGPRASTRPASSTTPAAGTTRAAATCAACTSTAGGSGCPRRRDDRAVVLSEYGGHSLRVEGHVYDDEVDFGYGARAARRDDLAASFTRLHERARAPTYRGA